MLPLELWMEIFSLCSSKERSVLCQVSKLCCSISLSVSERLSPLPELYKDTFPLHNKRTYYRKLYRSGDYHLIVRLKKKYIFTEHICAGNNIDVVRLMISHGSIDWDGGLAGACFVGNREIAELMILNGANEWNIGLRNACEGGHTEMTMLMMAYGAKYWNGGMYGACRGGHLELAQLMISMGADNCNWGLKGACLGGHSKMAHLMISHGADDWNWGLSEACEGGHRDLIELMILKGATLCWYCYTSIEDHTKKLFIC